MLQDRDLLVPNAEGRAVWRRTVRVDGQTDSLTLPRLPVAKLWDDPAVAPAEFAGTVETETAPASPAGAPAMPIPLVPAGECEPIPPIHPPAAADSPPADSPRGASAAGAHRPPASAPRPQSPPPPPTQGRQFLDWLIGALREGRLEYNSAKARVHVVPEGVLLTSPGLFRDYAEATGTDFEAIQRSFQKLKRHRVTSAGHNVHQYAVAGSGAMIKGFLLPEPALLFGEIVPAPNPVLKKL